MSFDLLTPSRKKSAAKMGRRAGGASNQQDLMALNDGQLSPVSSAKEIKETPMKAPPSALINKRRTGGWATSARGGGFGPPVEDQRLQEYDNDEAILEIPDLDDVVQDDFTQQVAQAPSVQVNRVATFKELDTDLLRHAAFSTLDDIDLRLLTTSLVNEADVREPDIEWKWDPLFAEVSSELQNESESEESDGEQEPLSLS